VLAPEQLDQRSGRGFADAAERERRVAAHVRLLVGQNLDQRRDRFFLLRLGLSQRDDGGGADGVLLVLQRLDQRRRRRSRRRTAAAERRRGEATHGRLAILE